MNSGIVFYSSWKPTLRVLAEDLENVPLVVTAWAQPEALTVRQTLIDMGWQPNKAFDTRCNPFASLVPQLVTDDHGTTNFNNRYITAFTGVKPQPWLRVLREAEQLLLDGDPFAAVSAAERCLSLLQAYYESAFNLHTNLGEALGSPRQFVSFWLEQLRPEADERTDLSAAFGVLGAALAHCRRLPDAAEYLEAAVAAAPAHGGGEQLAQVRSYLHSVRRAVQLSGGGCCGAEQQCGEERCGGEERCCGAEQQCGAERCGGAQAPAAKRARTEEQSR
eukprot:TRINITY_DN7482_c0_g1_i2.p3 TRINITY_DN7482_c0_g1~~TRINITY_DN7482_c0_g1_i2.p3  ORF type:complete len:277 (+),score=92.99 TRINITY_DN7482_c0_g1_i2:1214-2044(+)